MNSVEHVSVRCEHVQLAEQGVQVPSMELSYSRGPNSLWERSFSQDKISQTKKKKKRSQAESFSPRLGEQVLRIHVFRPDCSYCSFTCQSGRSCCCMAPEEAWAVPYPLKEAEGPDASKGQDSRQELRCEVLRIMMRPLKISCQPANDHLESLGHGSKAAVMAKKRRACFKGHNLLR